MGVMLKTPILKLSVGLCWKRHQLAFLSEMILLTWGEVDGVNVEKTIWKHQSACVENAINWPFYQRWSSLHEVRLMGLMLSTTILEPSVGLCGKRHQLAFFSEMFLLTWGEVDGGNVEKRHQWPFYQRWSSLHEVRLMGVTLKTTVCLKPSVGLCGKRHQLAFFLSEMILLTWGEVDGGYVEKSRLSKLVNWKEEYRLYLTRAQKHKLNMFRFKKKWRTF